ncbi:non-ribosomal peptide synthetase [Micromonospora echinospora]|uniref:Amino acid adenylation domain-containing protein n=1 Tax=Micromonospora echinospora TaxID=1877 RepID=A0ABR6MFU6_MICEC|nr:non-ribosomal peptide synthetase [Micromonospora echinospora]MBB5113495.1 amino acid adenylation domain-containing protein [Micromonospora echinospora]
MNPPHRPLGLPPGPAARLAARARAAGVGPAAVVLTATALLVRRYTGAQVVTLRHGDDPVTLDLTGDAPIRELCRSVRPAPPGSAVDATVRVGPDLRDVALSGLPADYAEDLCADLAEFLSTLDPDASSAGVVPSARYERRPAPDRWRLHGGDGAEAGRVRGDTIPAAFAATVEAYPQRLALLADDATVTYRELGAAVAATAVALAGPGDLAAPVAVLCRHGVATVTGILAALASGSPYVPLDPAYPAARLAAMLRDAGVRAIVTDPVHEGLAVTLAADAGPALPVVLLRQGDPGDRGVPVPAGPARPDDPAYVLYTSGSTGQPKGVVQSHRNVLFGVRNHVRNFAVRPDDRTSVLTSFGYDMAVTDTFSALLSGAAAVPVDVRAHGLGHLTGALADRGVTIYHSTPTVYRYVVASLGEGGRLPSVRAVVLGGEEVTRHDVVLARRSFAPGVVFVNGYGTTEISFAAQHHLPPDAEPARAVVPIGHPLPGIEVVLTDPAGRPACLTGEVVVRTPHVALGYLGLPELTAARFTEHGGVRAYRTGDVARRLPDGTLVYLGRGDRMVKIRGYRVELGEIEAHLAALPGVAHAAVVARRGASGAGEQEIVAYVVPVAGANVEPGPLRERLAGLLPDFMVPRAVVAVPELPTGPTGKLDQAALPDPDADRPAAGGPPSGPVEETIAAGWRAVLGLPAVDRQVNFFEAGGHSLQLALVQRYLEEHLGRRVPLARLVEFPTVAALAEHLATAGDAGGVPDDGRLAAVGRRMARRSAARAGGEGRA